MLLQKNLFSGNFVVEKIDMKMFVTLNNEDLLELKISAFGARKRLLMAINQLKAESRNILSSEQMCEYIHLSDFKDIPSLFTHLEMSHHIRNLKNYFVYLWEGCRIVYENFHQDIFTKSCVYSAFLI